MQCNGPSICSRRTTLRGSARLSDTQTVGYTSALAESCISDTFNQFSQECNHANCNSLLVVENWRHSLQLRPSSLCFPYLHPDSNHFNEKAQSSHASTQHRNYSRISPRNFSFTVCHSSRPYGTCCQQKSKY
ncbi:hypothetical protein F01_320004 [Burkholderia cenocepacia]|nr:hypothetical protein F01_320004 [Burkholderia cenocepacia]